MKTISSKQLSKITGEDHYKVMNTIRLLRDNDIAKSSFKPSVYESNNNREFPCFRLTLKGCKIYSTTKHWMPKKAHRIAKQLRMYFSEPKTINYGMSKLFAQFRQYYLGVKYTVKQAYYVLYHLNVINKYGTPTAKADNIGLSNRLAQFESFLDRREIKHIVYEDIHKATINKESYADMLAEHILMCSYSLKKHHQKAMGHTYRFFEKLSAKVQDLHSYHEDKDFSKIELYTLMYFSYHVSEWAKQNIVAYQAQDIRNDFHQIVKAYIACVGTDPALDALGKIMHLSKTTKARK